MSREEKTDTLESLGALELAESHTKYVYEEAQTAERRAKYEYDRAARAVRSRKAIIASRLGRRGAAECSTTGEVLVRVTLPWGTLTWNERIYTCHPAFYVSNTISGPELGDVIARTGAALQDRRDGIGMQLAALEKSIIDGLRIP